MLEASLASKSSYSLPDLGSPRGLGFVTSSKGIFSLEVSNANVTPQEKWHLPICSPLFVLGKAKIRLNVPPKLITWTSQHAPSKANTLEMLLNLSFSALTRGPKRRSLYVSSSTISIPPQTRVRLRRHAFQCQI